MDPSQAPSSGPQNIESHPPTGVDKKTSQPVHQEQWLTPIRALLLAGSSLIVIAVFVLVYSSWNSFSPAGRILATFVPLAILYILAFTNRNNANQAALAHYTLLTASIIFPFVVGVMIYQSNLHPTRDALLYFLIATVCFVWYVFLEFIYKNKWHAPFTILAAMNTAWWFNSTIHARDDYYSLSAVILGIILLVIGAAADRQNADYQKRLYYLGGGFLMELGLIFLPLTFLDFVFDTKIIFAYLISCAAFFILSIFFSHVWQQTKSEDALSLRRLFEITFAATLTVPAILATSSDPNQSLNALLAIVLGIVSIALSGFIRLQILRVLGYISAFAGIWIILVFTLREIKAAWPIALLVIGFLLIAIAYMYQHNTKIFGKMFSLPSNSLFGLGIVPEGQSVLQGEQQTHGAPPSGCMVLIAIVIAYYVIITLVSMLTGFY